MGFDGLFWMQVILGLGEWPALPLYLFDFSLLAMLQSSLAIQKLSCHIIGLASFGAVSLAALAAPLPAQAINVSPMAWWDVIGRDLKLDNARFTAVG